MGHGLSYPLTFYHISSYFSRHLCPLLPLSLRYPELVFWSGAIPGEPAGDERLLKGLHSFSLSGSPLPPTFVLQVLPGQFANEAVLSAILGSRPLFSIKPR